MASSDPAVRDAGQKVAASDPDAPAARGLRLDQPRSSASSRTGGASRSSSRPCAAGAARSGRSSSKGARQDEPARPAGPGRRPRAPALGRHRERPAPRGDAAPAASARGHVQLARRSRRRHRSRAPGRADERRVCDAPRPRRAPSCWSARSPSSWGRPRGMGRGRPTATSPPSACARSSTGPRRQLRRDDDAAHQRGWRAGRHRARRPGRHATDAARSRAGDAPRAAGAVREARVARTIRRRHRARDQQPAAGRARTSRAAAGGAARPRHAAGERAGPAAGSAAASIARPTAPRKSSRTC